MNCGNQVVENGREKKRIVVSEISEGIKKKSATFTIVLQYFHNKSQLISCYSLVGGKLFEGTCISLGTARSE